MNADVEFITDELRIRPNNSEVERLWADNSKATQFFNWKPNYAGINGFERGLRETIECFSQPNNIR